LFEFITRPEEVRCEFTTTPVRWGVFTTVLVRWGFEFTTGLVSVCVREREIKKESAREREHTRGRTTGLIVG
jgi:hypothetical protein